MSWERYTTTVVRISFPSGDVEIRPAPVSWTIGAFPEVEGHTIHIVTAYNPGGRAEPSAANQEVHRRLKAQVAATGLMWWPAAVANPTGTHVELSVAVAGLDDDGARALGAAHGQEAIFAWRPNAWTVLSCTDARVHITGWANRDPGHLSDESTTPTAAHDREPPSAAGRPRPYRSGRHDLLSALTVLAALDVFDPDGEFMSGLTSGAWQPDEIASVFAPWYDQRNYSGVEFLVDDIEMSTDGRGKSHPLNPDDVPDYELDRDQWDFGPCGGGSPGNADWGSVVLLRWGGRYIIYTIAGGECVPEDFEAASDDDAVLRFRKSSEAAAAANYDRP
jgi:hypothetical protein